MRACVLCLKERVEGAGRKKLGRQGGGCKKAGGRKEKGQGGGLGFGPAGPWASPRPGRLVGPGLLPPKHFFSFFLCFLLLFLFQINF